MGRRDTKRNGGRTQGRRLRLGGYPRVSRQGAREDERLRSPDFQLELMRGLAARDGFELVEYPAEIDVSGGNPSRAILERVLVAIEAGELDGIAVAALDRLSRLKPRDQVELIERIEDAGGIIRSASESVDRSTPEGRFTFDLFQRMARLRLEQYAENFEMAKHNAIDEGIAIKSVAPFGTRFTARHGLELVPHEAAVVLELFEQRAAGASYGRLAELFAERTGREVPRSTIRKMLENRTYLGELHYGRDPSTALVNRSPGFAAIVPAELFELVQAINLKRASGRGVAVNRAKSLLAGIAKCKGCGRGLVCTTTGSSRRPTYKCPADARLCPAKAFIHADALEAYVVERVLEWAGPAADQLVEVKVEHATSAERVIAEKRLEQAQAALTAHESDVELELELGVEAYRAGRQARLQLVERRRIELDALGEQTELELARTTLRQELASDGGELEVADRRQLLSVVLEAVIVRKTPYRNAPASERVRVVFRESPASPSD